uniref:Transposase n=1 Tax=Angiostrongylus cantonensis TaxID=6313 RepID=A0A0K0CTW4_ANGCA
MLTTKILKAGIDPHLFNHIRPIQALSCSNEWMFIDELVLTRTLTPLTPLLSHIPRNSSSPVSQTALNEWRRLVSSRPMTSYLIILACIIKTSIKDSVAGVCVL